MYWITAPDRTCAAAIEKEKEKKTWATGSINGGSLLPEQRTNK